MTHEQSDIHGETDGDSVTNDGVLRVANIGGYDVNRFTGNVPQIGYAVRAGHSGRRIEAGQENEDVSRVAAILRFLKSKWL